MRPVVVRQLIRVLTVEFPLPLMWCYLGIGAQEHNKVKLKNSFCAKVIWQMWYNVSGYH